MTLALGMLRQEEDCEFEASLATEQDGVWSFMSNWNPKGEEDSLRLLSEAFLGDSVWRYAQATPCQSDPISQAASGSILSADAEAGQQASPWRQQITCA